MKWLSFSVILISSFVQALEGNYIDNNLLPEKVCALVQHSGADTLVESERGIVRACSGFESNYPPKFISHKDCSGVGYEPSVIFCSGRRKSYFIGAEVKLFMDSDFSVYNMDGVSNNYSFRNSLLRRSSMVDFEQWSRGTERIIEDRNKECAVFSLFGEESDDIGNLRGVVANYFGLNETSDRLVFNVEGTLIKQDLGAPVMCRVVDGFEREPWSVIGFVDSLGEVEETGRGSSTRILVNTTWSRMLQQENKESLAREEFANKKIGLKRGFRLKQTIYEGGMFSYSEATKNVLVSSSHNICDPGVIDEEDEIIRYFEPGDKRKVGLTSFFGEFDLEFQHINYEHTNDACVLGNYDRKYRWRDRNSRNFYGAICRKFSFSRSGTELLCDNNSIIPVPVLEFLSSVQAKQCFRNYGMCRESRVADMLVDAESKYEESLCRVQYKSCMLNLPFVNRDSLNDDASNLSRKQKIIDAYYDVLSTLEKNKSSIGGNLQNKAPTRQELLYKRSDAYTQYESKCWLDHYEEMRESARSRRHIKYRKYEQCLLKNPYSYTGHQMYLKEQDRLREQRKREREKQIEEIKRRSAERAKKEKAGDLGGIGEAE